MEKNVESEFLRCARTPTPKFNSMKLVLVRLNLSLLPQPQLISSAGYPVEKHRAITADGYILQLHRIPAGRRVARRSGAGKGKKAVLVVHGLLGHSGDFVIMGPERSLAYLLADAGYDVWLSNLRGNLYTSHQNLTRDNPHFWEYSFHEHGKYDVPATIDKVLEVTGLSKVLYVGYSMGTTSFFTMMSERPEYNAKVLAFVALAPAVYLNNMRPLAEMLLRNLNLVDNMRAQGMVSLNLRRQFLDGMVSSFCYTKVARNDICIQIVYMLVGEDYEQYDEEMMSVVLVRIQPASFRQLEHFGKIAMSGVFTLWENGLYGAVKPYNFSKIQVPVSLVYGENDKLTEKSEIMRLAKELTNLGVSVETRPEILWKKFNHLDFTFAKDVGTLVSKPVVKQINILYNKYGNS